MMYVLMAGSRGWVEREVIASDLDWLLTFGEEVRVIEGGARGADTIARQEAERRGLRVLEVRPDWDRHGRSAGYVRNEQMIQVLRTKGTLGHRVGVLAYQVDGSRGTAHTIRTAERFGLDVVVREGF